MLGKLKNIFNRGGKFYKKILSVFIIFLIVIIIPFASVTFLIARKNITNSINSSNEKVLEQMKHNYTYSTDFISNITMSAFYKNEVQALLYNEEINFNDMFLTMRRLTTDLVNKHPSLYSIVIYNGKTKEFYSTETGGLSPGTNLITSFASEGEIPRLTPVLRKIPINSPREDVYQYCFSYILYDYLQDRDGDSSYIVVNQSASWFLKNIMESVSSDEKFNIYMASDNGAAFNSDGNLEGVSREDNYLIQKVSNIKEESGFFIESYNGEKSLVSYMSMDDDRNKLIMIQDYENVFKDLIKLRDEFIAICLIAIILSVALLIILSKRIYAPIQNLIGHISKSGERFRNPQDEFEHIKNQYDSAQYSKLELIKEKQSSRKIVERYLLSNMLQDSSYKELENYRKQISEETTLDIDNFNGCIILIHIEETKEGFNFLKEDTELLLYSVGNIMKELLVDEYEVVSIINEEKDLVLVVNYKATDNIEDHINKSINKMQEFMESRMGVILSVTYSEKSNDIRDLSGLYEQVYSLSDYKILYPKSEIISLAKCETNMTNKNPTYSESLKRQLEEKIKLGNIEQVEKVLWNIYKEIKKLNYDNIMINRVELLTRINMVINEVNMMKNNPLKIDFSEVYEKNIKIEYLDKWFGSLIVYIDDILSDDYEENQKESAKDLIFINMVTDYINENYMDFNLSSQLIADHVGISNRYFLKKFRDLTGLPLTQYITNIRLEQAVLLLRNTKMPVSEVAESVGIYSENYFYRLFKKAYGCTPREFSNQNNIK